jgi:hypothetical protein
MRRDLGIRLLIALNIGIALAYVGFWLIALHQKLTWRADFTAFYTAAVMVKDGIRGDQLYDFALQTRYQQEILGGRYLADGLMAFYYPPYVALLLAPLAFISRRSAYILWSVGQVVLVGVFLRRLWVFTKNEGWSMKARIGVLSIVAALPSLMFTLLLGSFSLLILMFLFELTVAVREESKVAAGLWMGLGSLKPQAMLFPGVMLLAAGRWQSLLVAASVTGLVSLVSAILLGPGAWYGFAGAVIKAFRASDSLGVSPTAMINLKGVIASSVPNIRSGLLNTISLGALILSTFIVAGFWWWERKHPRNFELALAVTLLCGLAFGPHVNPQDGLIAIVPGLWLYQASRERRSSHAWILLCVPGLMLAFDYDVPVSVPAGGLLILSMLAWGILSGPKNPASKESLRGLPASHDSTH